MICPNCHIDQQLLGEQVAKLDTELRTVRTLVADLITIRDRLQVQLIEARAEIQRLERVDL
jgi:hypothetical protein